MSNTVNPQIIDAITTTTSATVGEASSMAMGMFFQIEGQAFGLSMQNAVSAQNRMNQVGEAVVAKACARIMEMAGGG